MSRCSFSHSSDRVCEARALIPGGVNSSFRLGVAPTPLVFARGEGACLYDIDGNELIDYYLGLGPMILGHSPADVIGAARQQLDRGLLYGGQSELEYEAAALVCRMVPCADRVRFASSGSEAVQIALRLARAVTGRDVVLKFEGHYHGWLDSVLWSNSPPAELMGPEEHPVPHPASAGQDLPAGANLEVASWNRPEQVIDRLRRGDVAAVIMEAAMCNSGGIFPLPGYLETVRDVCTETGTVLIFDEVITGFRVAPGGAQEYFGVTPDLATFAKAIANGFSVAALTGRGDIMDRLSDGTVLHGGTYNAQPMAMAATVATLSRLCRQGTYQEMGRVGSRLMTGIEEAFDTAGLPVTVTGFPQIFHVGLGLAERPINYRGNLGIDRRGYRRLTTALLERGVRALERGSWFISTEHDDAIVDRTLAALRIALDEVGPELRQAREGG